ncbi:hypothetical protein ABPG74_019200 [Tetrahymena malaccensis]
MYDYKSEKGNKNLPQSCKPDIHPQQTKHEFGSIVFDSQFDSGNLEKVERNSSLKNNHFNLWVCNDCKGTQKATNYRTWFYFSVTGVNAETTLTFSIMNLNFQNKMFREGMQPTFKSSLSNTWQRVKSNIASTMENNDNGLEITWTHKFESPEEKVWFSFTYPFSYEDNEKFLKEYEQTFQNDSEIYMHRCTLIKSKEDRKIELLTISSQTNKLNQQEKAIPNLFTDPESSRPALFKNKKYVFFSARVHPGETPGSHVFNGIIKLLLNKDDARAKVLRDNFVFYCIPMINPDGVYRGHYRTDTNGLNLNRFYINPSQTEHPSVYAIKELILHLNETKRLHCYIDLHAHATKKGAFIYGNCLDLKDQLDTCLFPRLLSLNSPYFEYDSCNFTEKNMYCKDKGDGLSKEGAGRVALYKATKLNLCYTLECNYNTGTYTNKLFDYNNTQIENEKKDPDQYDQEVIVNGIDLQPLKNTTFYTIEIFEQIGEGICDALLDYSSIHPNSRIPNTPYKSLANIKMRMAYNLMRITPFRFCQYLRKVFRYISINENLERVLKCLWIYLHTGIKNDIADNTKPLVLKAPNENSKLNPLKRQATMQKKQITQDKNQTPNPSLLSKKQINASQERKIIQMPTSQLIGPTSPENEIKIISEMLINVNNYNKKRPMSQRQERQVSIFQDSNLLEGKKFYNLETDQANQNNDIEDDQSEGGQDEKEEREAKNLNDQQMQSYLLKNYNVGGQNNQLQQAYFSENNITQEYTPQSVNINREKIKKIVSNTPYMQRLDESFSQSLNCNQISDKIDDLVNQQGKFARQTEYQMPQLSIQEQYKLTSALPKRPTSKRLNHSYIRKNTIQQIQPVQQQNANKPLSDLSNQYDQNYSLNNQNYTANSNQNIFSPQSQPINLTQNQENKDSLKFNMIKVSDSKPYISEFDDRFAKIQNYASQQSQKIEEIAIKPKKIYVQQQQQQQGVVKQTRIIIDTLSKNKQRSESQKPYTVAKQNMQMNNRSKSRNTQKILPKKKVS